MRASARKAILCRRNKQQNTATADNQSPTGWQQSWRLQDIVIQVAIQEEEVMVSLLVVHCKRELTRGSEENVEDL